MIRSELDVLLDRIEDPALRDDLRTQIERLKQKRTFGLVFEQHIPERVRLPQHPIRVGSQVVSRDDDDSPTFEVVAIAKGSATLRQVRDPDGAYISRGDHTPELEQAPLDSLVVITEFGEPVLPGFRYLGAVERGGDKPYHVVINGENHHALEALRFTHAGKVDCIYIDPPYNSGARDWKYNNDYVDETDAYRHSKWLAFMERRLKLAKELLNPDDSVLIVTIDEREYLRLGLLLRQTFPDATMQMVSSLINAKGAVRANEFRRVDEYLYFLWFGEAELGRLPRSPAAGEGVEAGESGDEETGDRDAVQGGRADVRGLDWQTFRRRDLASRRGTRKGGPRQFYPIYVNVSTGFIEAVGDPLPHDQPRVEAPGRPGCVTVFPVRPDGTEMNWSTARDTFWDRWSKGYVRAGRRTPKDPQEYIIQYLKSGPIEDIAEGRAIVTGRNPDGSVVAEYLEDPSKIPTTQWAFPSHNAEHYGTEILKAMIPGRAFPFPKSVYAVEDALRLWISAKPHAVVLDYFAGSGTTAHALMRLNRQDGGRRLSIMVTNNEVSAGESIDLRKRGLRPGDPEWDALGIFEQVTRPRVEAAINGRTPEGEPIKGDYKFIDEFPMGDGFEENAAFLELRYLDADDVDLGLADDDIASLLWLRAGAQGPIARRTKDAPFVWTDRYGVLFDEDRWRGFVSDRPEPARAAFIVTHSPTTFAGIVAELPTGMDVVRLPDTYLSMFLPERGRA